MTFPQDPFSNVIAIPVTVQGITPKLGTSQAQPTTIPYCPPAGYAQVFSAADKANITANLAYVINLIDNGVINALNNVQINAISNVYAAWSSATPYGGTVPGAITVPQWGLQNTVITMQAMNYLQTTGLLTTTADLINSNGTIQMVTGFAPNGASTLTIHNQKVLCAVPDQNLWYASNVGNAASWNPLSAGDLETYSDTPLVCDQCYGYVIVFGEQSLEWFQDTGAQPFPYVTIPGAAYQVGLPAVSSRQPFMGNLVFLGRYKTGQMHVMQTNGTGLPVIISNPDIDQIINNFPNGQYQDAIASTDDFNGHPVYILTFPSAKRTFLYDGITQVWSELQSGTQEYGRHMTTLRATLNNGSLASDYASGNVYYVDPNNYTDNGYIIKREFVSKHLRQDGNPFSVTFLELNMQVGPPTPELFYQTQSTEQLSNTVVMTPSYFSSCSSPIYTVGVYPGGGEGYYNFFGQTGTISPQPFLLGPSCNIKAIWVGGPVTGANTVLLLHFDGANGATTTVDSSPYNQTIYINGTYASLNTHNPLYGTASLYAKAYNPGSTDIPGVTVPFTSGSVMDIFSNTAGWTIECQFSPSTYDGSTIHAVWDYNQYIPGSFAGNDLQMLAIAYANNTVKVNVTDVAAFGTGVTLSGHITGVTPGQYIATAVVCNNVGSTLYLNGANVASTTGWNTANYHGVYQGAANVDIGSYQAYAAPTAPVTIDEFRVSTGPWYSGASYSYQTAAFSNNATGSTAVGANVFVVQAQGTSLLPNAFTNVYFTDNTGANQVYTTASAVFDNSAFYQATTWSWPIASASNVSPWTADGSSTYNITFDWGSQVVTTNNAYFNTPHIELFMSTDGGYTWAQGDPAELGHQGQYTSRVYWRQLGTARDFLFKFRCTDPVPFIVCGGYATIEACEPD